MKENELHSVILAGLLHDIGKFYIQQNLCNEFTAVKLNGHGHAKWSACFVKRNERVFKNVPDLIDMVLYHGQPVRQKDYNGHERDENKKMKALLISIADKLSSKERRKEEETAVDKEERGERRKFPLLSVFNEINLGLHLAQQKKAYPLNPLAIEKEILFPKLNYPGEELPPDAYKKMCRQLDDEVKNVINADYITILYLLYKYTWACPSATPSADITPDVSLYDHARTTAAIAVTLFQNYKLSNDYAEKLNNAITKQWKREPLSPNENKILNERLFLLLTADMFGIQDFIYAASNIPGTSKRLRGRSFYLLMLNEIIARYIVYHPNINLSFVNILYCAAGNFQILLPNTPEIIAVCNKLRAEINEKLYGWFKGKLGFVFATEEISCSDFETWNEVLRRVEDKLNVFKNRKAQELLSNDERNIFFPKGAIEGRKDICPSCGETISYGEEICELCESHREIGGKLPRTRAIVFHQGDGKVESADDNFGTHEIDFGFLGKVTLIHKTKEETPEKPSLRVNGDVQRIEYYQLNNTAGFINSANFDNTVPSFGFKFLGNIVPTDKDGSVMEFEKIAEKSDGAKKLGVLKMDADLLELILQIGLSSDRTISRLATLSRMIELYFSGYIHKICAATEFKYAYIVFSGGDDLFLVGPWSKIPMLAKTILDNFKEYTCQNSDITLSAGIFICEPKFPVKRFAYLVSDELKKSKRSGRDRCTIFGATVSWQKNADGKVSFEELTVFAERLSEWVENGKIARGFLQGLLEIHHLYFSDAKKNQFLYFPRLLWQLVRNVKDRDVREELFIKFINSTEGIKWLENIKIPVCYALLKSRR